jgi:hypothetical protein
LSKVSKKIEEGGGNEAKCQSFCVDHRDSVGSSFKATRSFGDVIAGTLYALVDGGVSGLVFAWLYNLFVGKKSAA